MTKVIKKEFPFSNRIEYQTEDGKRHREDGPAVILANNVVEYWLNGIPVKKSNVMEKEKLSKHFREPKTLLLPKRIIKENILIGDVIISKVKSFLYYIKCKIGY